MNRKLLPVAVRRALLGLTSATAGALAPPALAQEQAAAAGESPTAIEEVVVVGRQRSAADDILQERIESEVVSDLVSIEQISRVGDSTVSLALRRLPGVTLVGDQFIYIRGLGERYSSTTVNGAYVPSPDLTRNVIPMDLFPAEIVESISIQKGYSADQPAAFGGGNVDIRTRSLPEDFTFNIQVGTGTNSESSDDGLTYPGGGDDDIGTDDGTRALPTAIRDAIQEYRGDLSQAGIFNTLLLDGEDHTFEEAQQINRQLATSLNRNVDFRRTSMDPDKSVEASVGNSWYLGGGEQWKLGMLALGDYSDTWRNRERIIRSAATPDVDFDVTSRTTNQVVLTGSLGVGFEFAEEHRLEATGIFLRNTEDEASLTLGHNLNFRLDSGLGLRNYRIRYEERELELFQLRGSHTIGAATIEMFDGLINLGFAEGVTFDWYYSDATAKTDIPSEILFSARDTFDLDTGAFLGTSIRGSQSSAEYRFSDLEDSATSYGSKLMKPYIWGSTLIQVSGGYDYYEKGRGYLQTQMQFGTTSVAAAPILAGAPGSVFTDEHILDPANQFALSIGGIGTESYLAGETVEAMWGKVDLNFNDRWRVSGGLRWEDFLRLSVPIDPLEFDPDIGIIAVPLDELDELATTGDDYYSSLSVTWMKPGFWADDFQLRFGWSETVARPDLREVSGSTFIDPLTEARVRGNPALLNSDLSNLDLRAEWFFESGDNLTLSLFYKDIDNPIETVEAAGTDDNISLTFINAESAEIYGLEVEGLKGLGFLSGGGWTEPFFVAGNVTASDSEIRIGAAAVDLTNAVRPMTQHSDLVVNFQLGYDSPNEMHSVSLAYNMYSERIFFAGRGGADDATEQPFDSLDLVYGFHPTERMSVKLRLQNLLEEDTVIEQGGVDVLEQNHGLTGKVDFAYRF
ncbi:MAG: TonB-dependent receptor domain-containing protein [Steroidobacteraceae bacterium]